MIRLKLYRLFRNEAKPARVMIKHRHCRGLFGYYVGDGYQPIMRAADFEFLDGSHPKPGDPVIVMCSKCKGPMKDVYFEVKKGSKYWVVTFHIDEGRRIFHMTDSLFSALWVLWQVYRMKYYGVVSLEVR